MNLFTRVSDSLTNLVSRMGTDRDKASHSFYGANVLTDDQIAYAYDYAWLPRKIVDIPAFDSIRAWRDWQAETDQITAIESEEKRLGLQRKVLEAKVRARLWGGAAILIGTGDAILTEALDVERLGKDGIKYLTVLTCRELTAGDVERDPASEWYGQPKEYLLSPKNGAQIRIHPSRLAIFHGNARADPNLSVGAYRGWGDSVLQSVMDAIKQADGTAANIASLVFEAKVDVIKVPKFTEQLLSGGADYENQLLKRFTLAATAKGINGALILDAEEDYQSKSASFATLPDVLDRFLQIVSGAADIPATRLLGQAPAGMNSTGESDMKNYHDRLSAMQAIETTPAMFRLDECLIRSALGSRPAEVHFNWSPLWGMSEKEKAEVFNIKATAARTIAGTGGASPTLIAIEALSKALTNELIEDAALAGLEAAVEEFGTVAENEPDEDDDDDAAGSGQKQLRQAANDAAPRPLYVRRDVLNSGEIISWAKSQGFETTLAADDLHVTITFSRTPVDWMKMGDSWSGDGKGNITINPGGARMMEQFGKATVLLFASSELSWRHESMKQNGASWDHDEYQPHVTISYSFDGDLKAVEPYRGKIVLGPEIFEDIADDWQSNIVEE